MDALIPLFLVYVVFLGALLSPGPDMMITLRNALGFSTRAGIFTALGIGAGLVIHMTYCVAGIGIVIAQSPVLFAAVKYIGAGYLIYLGVQSLRSKGVKTDDMASKTLTRNMAHHQKSDRKAFTNGFATNLFNPKATMFFLALFSQMIDPATPLSLTLLFCLACILTATIWFSLLSIMMGARTVRMKYAAASQWIDRIFGGFFIFVGVKLALTKMG